MGPPHQAVAALEIPNRTAAAAAIAIFFIGHLLRWKKRVVHLLNLREGILPAPS
jgi:hypothetical protein